MSLAASTRPIFSQIGLVPPSLNSAEAYPHQKPTKTRLSDSEVPGFRSHWQKSGAKDLDPDAVLFSGAAILSDPAGPDPKDQSPYAPGRSQHLFPPSSAKKRLDPKGSQPSLAPSVFRKSVSGFLGLQRQTAWAIYIPPRQHLQVHNRHWVADELRKACLPNGELTHLLPRGSGSTNT